MGDVGGLKKRIRITLVKAKYQRSVYGLENFIVDLRDVLSKKVTLEILSEGVVMLTNYPCNHRRLIHKRIFQYMLDKVED